MLGDFSGRANRGLVEDRPGLASRRPLRIDRDDFDRVMAELRIIAPAIGRSICVEPVGKRGWGR